MKKVANKKKGSMGSLIKKQPYKKPVKKGSKGRKK